MPSPELYNPYSPTYEAASVGRLERFKGSAMDKIKSPEAKARGIRIGKGIAEAAINGALDSYGVSFSAESGKFDVKKGKAIRGVIRTAINPVGAGRRIVMGGVNGARKETVTQIRQGGMEIAGHLKTKGMDYVTSTIDSRFGGQQEIMTYGQNYVESVNDDTSTVALAESLALAQPSAENVQTYDYDPSDPWGSKQWTPEAPIYEPSLDRTSAVKRGASKIKSAMSAIRYAMPTRTPKQAPIASTPVVDPKDVWDF